MANLITGAAQVFQMLKDTKEAYNQAAANDANATELRNMMITLGTLMVSVSTVSGAASQCSASQKANISESLQHVEETVEKAHDLATKIQKQNKPKLFRKLLKALDANDNAREFSSIATSLQTGLAMLNTALANCQRADLHEIRMMLRDHTADSELLEDIMRDLSLPAPAQVAQGVEGSSRTATQEDVQLLRQELFEMQQAGDSEDVDGVAFVEQMTEIAIALSLADQAQPVPSVPPPAGDLYGHMLCPITNELMTEPVMLVASGVTYEKDVIKQWIDQEHRLGKTVVCPVTRKAIPLPAQLVPNYALKGMIDKVVGGQ